MTLFLNILSLLNPLRWIEKGFQWLKRPKIEVYFDPEQTYHTRIVVDANNVQGFFCHLMVKNEGKSTIKKCRARVIDLSVHDENGVYSRHPDFSHPFTLKWGHENDYLPKDIEIDIPRRLDLCYGLQSTPGHMFFFTEQKPDGNLTIYPCGTYRVTVRVDAENAKHVDRSFLIKFSGEWDQINVSDHV